MNENIAEKNSQQVTALGAGDSFRLSLVPLLRFPAPLFLKRLAYQLGQHAAHGFTPHLLT